MSNEYQPCQLPPFEIKSTSPRSRDDIKKMYHIFSPTIDAQVEGFVHEVPEHLVPPNPAAAIDTTFNSQEVIDNNDIPKIIPAFTGLRKSVHEQIARRHERRIEKLVEDDQFVRFAARAVIQGGNGAGKNLWLDTHPDNKQDPEHIRPDTFGRQLTLLRLERKWHKRGHMTRLRGARNTPYTEITADADGNLEFDINYHKGPKALSPMEQKRVHKAEHHSHVESKKIQTLDEGLPLVRNVRKGGFAGMVTRPAAKAKRAHERWEKSTLKIEALKQAQEAKSSRRSR